MSEFVVVPPRTVSLALARSYAPWLELTGRVRLTLPAWQLDEDVWVHLAAPSRDGAIAVEEARVFEPGRRAAAPGPPPAGARDSQAPGDAELRAAAALLWARWRAPLHRHLDLGVASHLGESVDAFRRRCLATFSPAIRAGQVRGQDAADLLARLAAGIESREITAADVTTPRLEVRVAWYPADDGPAVAPAALLVTGEPGSRR